jgi:acyl-CoA synthetase (AMP-forming)/AMP-acid ligase II
MSRETVGRTALLEALGIGARLLADLPKILPTARSSPAKMMQRWARRTPRNLALAYLDERFTWGEVNDRANQYASWFLDHGLVRGDVVALMMDNRPDFLFIVMALNKIGAIGSLINTNLSGSALAHAINVCDAKKVLAGGEHLEPVLAVDSDLASLALDQDLWVQVESGEPSRPGVHTINEEIAAAPTTEQGGVHVPSSRDIYCYIYTSGTTGLPKAAIIRNQRMLGANITFGRLMHRSGPGDVIYVALPLYHSSAMFLGWGAALATGASIALRRKFSVSSFWKDARDFRATSFLYIGELCRYLMNAEPRADERDHQLRVGVGNGMSPNIWGPFQERFGIPVIREFYGATEGISLMMNYQGRPGMVGKLSPGQAIVKCDLITGEIIRNARGFCDTVGPGETGLLVGRISPVIKFDGYVDAAATNEKIIGDVFKKGDRFFNTGDLLTLHEGRWLSFADRVGDTFRWKGENVSTAEVSSILGDAPGVFEANVYGVRVPNAEGRVGMAAVAVADDFDLQAFSDFVREQLPGYQCPRFLRILTGAMRVTGTFKHQKVDYRREGYDAKKIEDPLYLWNEGVYVGIDAELHARIESGDFQVT